MMTAKDDMYSLVGTLRAKYFGTFLLIEAR